MNTILNILKNEQDIKNILEINPDIKELSEKEIFEILNIFIKIGCNRRQIKHIIISNPFCLNIISDDLIELINKLKSLGITNLNITFDTNPYLLNKSVHEIDRFIEEQKNDGLELEDIIDMIDSGDVING